MLLGKLEEADFNIYPSKYPWARELYEQAVANTWFPHEIALKEDRDDYETMTEEEQAIGIALKAPPTGLGCRA